MGKTAKIILAGGFSALVLMSLVLGIRKMAEVSPDREDNENNILMEGGSEGIKVIDQGVRNG